MSPPKARFDVWRPYVAAFASRFSLLLQYRVAALAGFVTQCWWGAIKVMTLAAFYGSGAAAAPGLRLSEVITYTWLGQGLLALLPWTADPDVVLAVRTGSVAYDRVRPVDAYALWFARAAGWLVARALPRAFLMVAFAAVLLPSVGLADWSLRAPATLAAGLSFVPSLVLGVLLSSAVLMLINAFVVVAREERGVIYLASSIVVLFSGNLLPLALFPDELAVALLLQPLAGLLDIPLRIYFGRLSGTAALGGMALQAFWALAFVVIGRRVLSGALGRFESRGG